MKPEARSEGVRQRWDGFLKEFSRQNGGRLTRLGVIKRGEKMDDLWLEDGLPLAGVDLDCEGAGAPLVQIMLGKKGGAEHSMTHVVNRVRSIVIRLTSDGREDGLDIEDEPETTVLRFEPRSME